jgi:1-acyl-sn-glycerol-3-phosphate acyltransferase
MTLSGQEYVDVYGATVKKSMTAGASAADAVATLQPPAAEAADRAPTSLAG